MCKSTTLVKALMVLMPLKQMQRKGLKDIFFGLQTKMEYHYNSTFGKNKVIKDQWFFFLN